MVEISASQVMELRQKTGAKMMDAKRALVDAEGDMDKAVELLRERGMADAGKRQHRAAAEGTIATVQSADQGAAAMAELNCETDFVAKTDPFKQMADALTAWVLSQSADTVTADNLPANMVTDLGELIRNTGENVQFKRGVKFTSANGVVGTYIHLGGKIGVMVQIDGANNDEVRALAKDLAMQIAAASPDFLSRDEVPQATIEKELEIYRQQARNEGKPEQILDKIATGKVEKYFKDSCLLEQAFVKDPDTQVKALVADVAKRAGADLTVTRFIRYQLGQ